MVHSGSWLGSGFALLHGCFFLPGPRIYADADCAELPVLGLGGYADTVLQGGNLRNPCMYGIQHAFAFHTLIVMSENNTGQEV